MDSVLKPIILGVSAAALAAAMPAKAQNDTWPCEIMLCMASPGGPYQFRECAPAIQRLVRHLALGGGFPICRAPGVDPTLFEERADGDVRLEMPDGTVRSYGTISFRAKDGVVAIT